RANDDGLHDRVASSRIAREHDANLLRAVAWWREDEDVMALVCTLGTNSRFILEAAQSWQAHPHRVATVAKSSLASRRPYRRAIIRHVPFIGRRCLKPLVEWLTVADTFDKPGKLGVPLEPFAFETKKLEPFVDARLIGFVTTKPSENRKLVSACCLKTL